MVEQPHAKAISVVIEVTDRRHVRTTSRRIPALAVALSVDAVQQRAAARAPIPLRAVPLHIVEAVSVVRIAVAAVSVEHAAAAAVSAVHVAAVAVVAHGSVAGADEMTSENLL